MADEQTERLQRLRRNPRWGKWRFKRRALVLEHSHHGYQVPLERCNSASEILDWLLHLQAKRWCTAEDVGQLLEAFDALLFLTSYCNPAGKDDALPTDVYQRLKASGWIRQPRRSV